MSGMSSISTSTTLLRASTAKQSQSMADSSTANRNGSPWKIVENEVLKSLGASTPTTRGHGHGHPHAVHDVVNAVESALNKASSSGSDAVPAMLDTLNKGFDNARSALAAAGFDDATIDNVIGKFRSQLSDALQKESNRLGGSTSSSSATAAAAAPTANSSIDTAPASSAPPSPTSSTTPAPSSTAAPVQTTGPTALDYTRRDSFSLKIQTQEGDLVTIKLRTRDALQYNSGDATYSDTSQSGKNLVSYSTSRMVVDIRGDLNDSEMAAVRDVIQQAQGVASEFFSGDVQSAFSDSANLHADADQIAGFALKLSTRETLRTSAPALPASTSSNDSTSTPVVTNTTTSEPTDTSTPAADASTTTTSTPATDSSKASDTPVSSEPVSSWPLSSEPAASTAPDTTNASSTPATTNNDSAPNAFIKYLQNVISWARVTPDHATLAITTRSKLELVAASAQLQAPSATDSSSLQRLHDLLNSAANAASAA